MSAQRLGKHDGAATRARRLFPWMVLFALGLICPRVVAGLVITNVSVVNLTPSSFSVVWLTSPLASGGISVFSDPGGATSLVGQVGVEFYPLHTGDPNLTNAYARRLDQSALRQKTMGQGLVEVEVSGCSPGTTYYYRLQATNASGQQVVWPASGPLPGVTTAIENAFVVQSRQLVLSLPGEDPSGSIVLLSNSNTPSLLAAVAGDGVASNEVYFSVADLIAATGNTNYLPLGSQQFTAQLLGPISSNFLSQTFTLNFTTDFLVGQESQFSFGQFLSLTIGSAVVRTGTSGSLPLQVYAAGVTNLSFLLSLPTNRFSALSLRATSPQLGSAVLQILTSNLISITLNAAPGQALVGNEQVALLNFTTASNQSSAFLPLLPQSLQAIGTGGSVVSQLAAQGGRVVIVGSAPLLEASLGANGARNLTLYGIPGDSYQIQSSATLAKAPVWGSVVRVPMTNLEQVLSNLGSSQSLVFYRAYQFVAEQPILDITRSSVGPPSLVLYGTPGVGYEVEYTSSLGSHAEWSLLARVPLTNSFQILTGIAAADVFYRAVPLTNTQPILDIEPGRLVLYGMSGYAYEIDFAPRLSSPVVWSLLSRVPLSGGFDIISLPSGGADFYRASLFQADPPLLEAHLGGQSRSLLAYGLPGTNYTLQYSTNLSSVVAWYPLMNYTLTNSFRVFSNLSNPNPSVFYRLKR